MPPKLNHEKFLQNAHKKHGDTYEYPEEIIDRETPIHIICKFHGEFKQAPFNHFRSGCPKCSGNVKKTFEDFSKELLEFHKGRITVEKEDFNGLQKNIKFTCIEHGEQEIRHAYNLLRGLSCPKCVIAATTKALTKDHSKFVEEARLVHGELYAYPEEYIKANDKLGISCSKHGVFLQTPSQHLKGSGCPKCATERLIITLKSNIKNVKEKMSKKHYGKYDYSDFNTYENNRQFIDIICPKHGKFTQKIGSHLINGCGCPKCANKVSKAVIEIEHFLKEQGVSVELNNRSILKQYNQELDIVIEDKKLAIEFNGLYFHKEGLIEGRAVGKDKDYHLNKTLRSNEAGYKLIHIFEDEWLNKKEIVLSKIAHAVGISKGTKIHARKCTISEISTKVSNEFLNKFHIQGGDKTAIKYGAFFGETLIAVMTFLDSDGEYNLNRFAVNNQFIAAGIAAKILKHAIKIGNPKTVKTFADRRWTLDGENNLYTKLGFSLVET